MDGDSQRGDAVRRLLLSLGTAHVQVCESGRDAIKAALGTHRNLVIAEYHITPMDGIQLVRDIRAAVNYPRALLPILIVSDPVGSDIIAAAFEAGANHFLISDSRAFVVKDGHYVIKPAKPKVPAAAVTRVSATK